MSSFKRKDLVFGATSRKMEVQHLELVNNEIQNKKEKSDNSQKEILKIKESAKYGDRWDKLEAMEEISRIEHSAKYIQTALKDLKESPYFARLDFQEGSSRKDICYISKGGINSIIDNRDNVNYVNWRAPIASLYYKYNGRPIRNVSYRSPSRTINGDIAQVARIRIENKELKDFSASSNGMVTLSGDFDIVKEYSKVQKSIEDDLQEKLASNSSDKMTEIVETIQGEQDEIIRFNTNQSVIIQGAAGSGKTSIALHRVAYMLYEDLKDYEVLFISPNKDFSDYISEVLPELGELNVPIKTFDEIYAELFNKDTPDSLYDIIEDYYQNGVNLNIKDLFDDKIDISADNAFKASEDVKEKINNLKEALFGISSDEFIKFKKDGSEKELEEKTNPSDLTHKKLHELISIPSYENIWNSNCGYYYTDEKGNQRTFLPEINKQRNTDFVYYAIIKTIINDKKLENFTREINYLADGRTVNPKKPMKQVAHAIKHIVVDEAQDYTKWHMYLLHLLCPNAKFTILGDKNQNINPYMINNSLENILEEVDNMAAFFQIKNAYRSSPEIVEYTNAILGADIVAKRRSQNVTVDEKAKSSVNDIAKKELADDIRTLQSEYHRIGVVCRNKTVSDYISILLGSDAKNVSILPVYKAKGLEFDAAIVINTFNKIIEKELLYTACTRAQHKLVVYNISE